MHGWCLFGRRMVLTTTFLSFFVSPRCRCWALTPTTSSALSSSASSSLLSVMPGGGRNMSSSLGPVVLSSDLTMHRLDSVESTQDEARRLLHVNFDDNRDDTTCTTTTASPYLAVSAKEQVRGRGTSGRTWMGQPGNLFLTVALPSSKLHSDFSLTLLPLQIGNLLADRLKRVLKECYSSTTKLKLPNLSLKWPNDVLVDGNKVAGVLMESELVGKDQYFLVGIGVNLVQAPEVPLEGTNRGRPAAAVLEHCTDDSSAKAVMAQDLGDDLAVSLVEWWRETNADSGQLVLDTWRASADFGISQTIRETGEVVQPVLLEDDGQLRVRGQDGQERLLVTDYLF